MTSKQNLLLQIIIAIILTIFIWVIAGVIPNEGIVGMPRRYSLDYPWKYLHPTLFPIITATIGFLLHQLFAWYVLYKAKAAKLTYTDNLAKYNYQMMGIHFIFTLLHFLHTIFFYDALAQVTPEWLSQGSVIVLLILIFIILNDKRGLLFGKRFPMPKNIVDIVKKNHGYYMLLAMIFTFWYHPMESTIGHLIGFLYMFILFIQSSLMYTKSHMNSYWIFCIEIFVLFHGVLVAALVQNSILWTMFYSGFGFLAVFSQMYIFRTYKNNRKLQYIIQFIYLLSIILLYSGIIPKTQKLNMIHQFSWIPIIELIGVYVIIFLLGSMNWIATKSLNFSKPSNVGKNTEDKI